jgi:hypothetical protein
VARLRFVYLLLLPAILAGAIPTSLTLAPSQNPSAYGQPITLIASVSPDSATGKVSYYDGVHIPGISTLKGGQAILPNTILPSGSATLYVCQIQRGCQLLGQYLPAHQ